MGILVIGKYCTIQVFKALRDVPRKSHSCNPAAKCDSNMYRLRGVNTYVNEIFLYFIFNTFENISKNMFYLSNYGALCVDE
jgi:hypothetical protein